MVSYMELLTPRDWKCSPAIRCTSASPPGGLVPGGLSGKGCQEGSAFLLQPARWTVIDSGCLETLRGWGSVKESQWVLVE